MTAKISERQKRQAAALRENLKRRKARARALAKDDDPKPLPPGEPEAEKSRED